jgi:hypothetical protein
MGFPRAQFRRCANLFAAVVLALAIALSSRAALAGNNDLHLLNLCRLNPTTQECEWLQRDPTTGAAQRVNVNTAAQARFRSLMSELGVVLAPRLVTPADTLGFAGFQFSAELGLTQISAARDYWDGVTVVNPANRLAQRPNNYLTTIGGYARKGFWLPVPAFELGGGFVNVLGSSMFALQAYAKIALQEGFHGWALPSVAVRGSVSQLVGTDQVDMTVAGVDVVISKAFSVGGTARFEPFLGWNMLFIDARSGVIDATPKCDAYALQNPPAGAMAPSGCPAMQAGKNWDDLNANFTFPRQDVITRQRFSGGFKLKLAVLFFAAAYEIIPAGRSHDETQPVGARDDSQKQQSFALSAGFDF